MDGMTEHEKAIAWLWVVEGMATMKQFDVTLLQELLIEIGPALPDHMTNTIKERVALRCLEEIFDPPNDSMNIDIPFTHHSKVTFDLSQSCETVLKRIIDETPPSDLKNSGPGLLKWDIHPFIVQKKSAMPKCALKQLKESILNGTHLHAHVLREKSSLTCKKDSGGVPGSETSQSHNECLSNAQNMGVEVNSGLVHDISERAIHTCDLAENQMPMEENEVFEDGHNHYAEAKRFRRSSDGAFHENQTQSHITATSMPQDTSQNEVQLYQSVGEAKNDVGLNRELGIPNVAPPEETQHKASSEEFNCYNKHDVHIEVPQVSVTDKLRERSNADEPNGPYMPVEKHKSVNDSEDYHTRSKSTIWDPSAILQSIEQNQLPLFLEESSERDVVRRDLAEDQTIMMEEDTIEEDGHGAYIHANHKSQLENRGDAISMPQDICQDGPCHYTCNDETMDDDRLQLDLRASGVAALGESQQKVSTKVFNNNTGHDFHIKGPHPATMDGPQQKNLANKVKDDSENCSKLRTSTVALLNETQQKSIADKSKKPIDDDIDGLLYEKIDAIMKEHALLISECASSHDSSATTLKENYHFVECDEGCQFLSCKTCNCPMVVPEYWLRKTHERNNLYCPLCSYKHSRTDYLESEKETSLRKKHRQAFNFAMENQPKEPVGSLPSKVNYRSRNFETLIEKSYQNRRLEEHKERQGDDHVNEVDGRQFHHIIADKQQIAPSPCTQVSSRLAELHVSAGEKKGKKKGAVHEGMSIAGLARFQYQPLEGDKLSSKNTGSFLIGQGQADAVDAVPDQEDLQQNITDDSEDIHELTVNTENIPEDDGSNTSKYSSRQRSKFPCTQQAITQSRRK